MNKFEPLAARKVLGKPTASGVQHLIDLIYDRLIGYEGYNSK